MPRLIRRQTTTSRVSPAAEAGAPSAALSACGVGGGGGRGEHREEEVGRRDSRLVGGTAVAASPATFAAAVISGCIRGGRGVVAARTWRKLAGERGRAGICWLVLFWVFFFALTLVCAVVVVPSRRLSDTAGRKTR